METEKAWKKLDAAPRSEEASDLAALVTFATRHRVQAILEQPLHTLYDRIPSEGRSAMYRSRAHCLLDLFGAIGNRSLRKMAWAVVEQAAKEADDELRAEARRLALPPPVQLEARELHARVLAAHAALRAKLPARNPSQQKLDVSVLPDPPTLRVAHSDWPHRAVVEIGLQTALPTDALSVSCSHCKHPGASCAYALTALDVLLELLADPRRAAEAEPLLVELTRPHWVRALADLDRRLDEASDPGEVRFAWRIGLRDADITVGPTVQKRSKNGFSKGAPVSLRELLDAAPGVALDADREAALVLGSGLHTDPRLVNRALLALAGHPRVFLDGPDREPIQVRSLSLGFTARDQAGGGVTLEPTVDGVAVDPALLAGDDPLVCVFHPAARSCLVVRIDERARSILELLRRRGGSFAPVAARELALRLPALSQRVSLTVSQGLRGREVPADTALRLRLDVVPSHLPALRVAARLTPLAGGPVQAPGEGPTELLGVVNAERVHVVRDLDAEIASAEARLEPLGLFCHDQVDAFSWLLEGEDGAAALDFVYRLKERADDFVVEWGTEDRLSALSASAGDLRVSVADKKDWFGVTGGVFADGAQVPLAQLLAAVRDRRRYVQVRGGAWLRIADDLRARLQASAEVAFEGRSGLEMARHAVPALAELVGAGDGAELSARFGKMVERLRTAHALSPEVPAELAPILRDYQKSGYAWLSRLAAWSSGAILADDMGLGKTVQSLALLVERSGLGPALVVAPTSVGWNWMREMERFAPSLRGVLYRESDDRAAACERLGPGDVLVVSYTLLANDVEALSSVPFATVVLDEAQAVKNATTQRARAVLAVSSRAGFRLALSGTPVENRLAELWALFRIVAPGLLGSWEQFRTRFAVPIERDRDGERQAALGRVIRPFLLRRVKAEVAPELPARLEVREDITLSPGERGLYEQLRRAVLAELGKPTAANAQNRRFAVLTALLRLRQLACHPRLLDDASTVPSAKLERCLELVEELREGGGIHRALVFSQFTSHLALVREALAAAGVPHLYLDGATPAGERQQLVDTFQQGRHDVFLISLKAGGTGLNLTAADVVIHLDPWWNPAVEDQATDRAHRIGQERPVTVYRLVARGTVEETILDLHADKRRLVTGLLDGTGNAAALPVEELVALLSA